MYPTVTYIPESKYTYCFGRLIIKSDYAVVDFEVSHVRTFIHDDIPEQNLLMPFDTFDQYIIQKDLDRIAENECCGGCD